MKINLLFFLLLASFSQVIAQSDPVYAPGPKPELKLYRVTIKPVSGEQFTDILYAVTDSTLMYFDTDRAMVQQVKLGISPELKTIRLTDIRRIAVRRQGHFWRSAGLGVGLGAVTYFVLAPSSTPDWGALMAKLFLGYMIAPALVLSGLVQGIFPEKYVYIMGSPYYVANARNKLYRYTITAQQRTWQTERP